jgi:hypothetical protein
VMGLWGMKKCSRCLVVSTPALIMRVARPKQMNDSRPFGEDS